MNDRITIRLGALYEQLLATAAREGIKPSELARKAIANALGAEPPAMTPGNPNIVQHAARGGRTTAERKKNPATSDNNC